MPSTDEAVPCALCEDGTATRRGEHVLPAWYLRDQDRLGPPPYSWSVNGEPIRDRGGRPLERRERTRILLPVCKRCNGILERRFETPAKDIVRQLFARQGIISLDDDEAKRVGLWVVKTLLLQAHPEARYADPVVERYAKRWKQEECPPRRFFDWLVDGSEPPDGLSLWVFRTDEGDDDRGRADCYIPLPDVTADGMHLCFVSLQRSWHGLDTTLIVHPGWRIDHPIERDGRAVRLLPGGGPADLSGLPVLRRRSIGWMRCRVTLRDGALGSPELPPLSPSMFPFPALPELVPFVTMWSG